MALFRNQKSLTKCAQATDLSNTLKDADFPNITKITGTNDYVITTLSDYFNNNGFAIADVKKYDLVYYDANNNLYRSKISQRAEMVAKGLNIVGIVMLTPAENNGTGVIMNNNTVDKFAVHAGTESGELFAWMKNNYYASTENKTGLQLTQEYVSAWESDGSPTVRIGDKWTGRDGKPVYVEAQLYSKGPFGAGSWYMPSIREMKKMITTNFDRYCFEDLYVTYNYRGQVEANVMYIPASDFFDPVVNGGGGWGNTTKPDIARLEIGNWSGWMYGRELTNGQFYAGNVNLNSMTIQNGGSYLWLLGYDLTFAYSKTVYFTNFTIN